VEPDDGQSEDQPECSHQALPTDAPVRVEPAESNGRRAGSSAGSRCPPGAGSVRQTGGIERIRASIIRQRFALDVLTLFP
jgi:hypothetical protein